MKIKDIIDICDGRLLCGNDELEVTFFSKDTRTINKSDTYVGIKGDHFDGNDFIEDAFDKGVSTAIIDKKMDVSCFKNKTIIYVKDTIECLCKLAKVKRNNFKGTVIGITGSVGKTTTKDLIVSVLETTYDVLKTEGSFNNNIGLPLSILNGKDAQIWVIEIGMNNFGEISFLSKIVRPHYSVITNIGTSHIGILGSRENILKAKLEILDGMEKNNLIINNDNDLLHQYYLNNKNDIITVGIHNNSDYNIEKIDNYDFKINDKKFKLFGTEEPLLIDSTLAYAVGKLLNVDDEKIYNAFNNFKQLGNRLKEVRSNSGFLVINDAFNANFDSVKLAIEYLSNYKGRKIIVLGDMLELGEYSKELHRDVGKLISNSSINVLITVGELSNDINISTIENGFYGIVSHFSNNIDCLEYIKSIIDKNDTILVKASKKMDFVNLCNKIIEL